MRILTALLIGLLFPALTGATLAIVNVNVVPMSSDRVIPAQTVIVRHAMIESLGPVDSTELPEDSKVIDGTDRYLMPGLAEMHAHVPPTDSQQLDRALTLFAANGVTLIRGMLGRPSHLELRDSLLTGDRFAPRLVTSGPSFNGSSVSGPADARRQVRSQKAAGYDFLKIHPGLSHDEFVAIAETANELNMPFAGHVPASVDVLEAVGLGMSTIDHLDGYFAAMMPADTDRSGGYGGFFSVLLADQLREDRIEALARATKDTWNVPTQALIEHRISRDSPQQLAGRPAMRYMPAATVQQWVGVKERQLAERGFSFELGERTIKLRRQLIKALYRNSGRILLGSDAPQVFNVPGFSAHEELQTYVAAGLTPYEALATGTINVARYLGSNGGRVAAGADADLVLLDGNPLSDIRNTQRIHGVILRGHWFDARAIDEQLKRYERTATTR